MSIVQENEAQCLGGLQTLAQVKAAHIRHVMEACGGDVGEAARVLDVGRATLYRWLERMSRRPETRGERLEREKIERALAVSRALEQRSRAL